MKKNILYLTVIMLLISLIIISIFIVYYLNNTTSSKIVTNISDINEAYNVKTCAQKFYLYCKDYRISAPSSIYDLLDKEYIKKYGVNKNEINEYIHSINSDTYKIKHVYKIQEKNSLSLFLVKGYEVYRKNEEIKEFSFLLKIDNKQNTFSIFLQNYIDEMKYNEINLKDEINIKLSSIKKNYNNTFDKANKNMYDNVKDIYTDYKRLCMFYERYSYEVLSEKNKKEQFQNYETYYRYILNRFKDIVMSDMIKYENDIKDDKIVYICYDNYGKKYIFNVYSYITYDVIIEDN